MTPARTYPARRDDVRLLLIDPAADSFAETRTTALPDLLGPADLLVVNDAATLPASLRGHDDQGRAIELRLLAAVDQDAANEAAGQAPEGSDGSSDGSSDAASELAPRAGAHFWAALLGAGDWHQRTEDRPPPPALSPGDRLRFGALGGVIVARAPLSARLVSIRFDVAGDALWAALYREARPIQYAHLAHELPLWAVQTVYATRPWAFEMPSAGRPLSWDILLSLRRAGGRVAALTHAAGVSATGDAAIDAALPLPERFDIPAATVNAIKETRRRAGRVIAVGTTVVRALEGAADTEDGLRPGPGTTDLRIDDRFRPRVVDGILSGIHAPAESHFALLGAFAGADLLRAAARFSDRHDFKSHELGDAMLIARGILATRVRASRNSAVAAAKRRRADDCRIGISR